MSWDAYVDLLMAPIENGSKLAAAAICGIDGGIWASGGSFPPMTTDQVLRLANGFDVVKITDLQANGLIIGEDKYRLVQCEPGSDPGAIIRAKFEKMSLCAIRTASAVVLGFCKDPTADEPGMSFGDGTMVVQKVVTTLLEYGY